VLPDWLGQPFHRCFALPQASDLATNSPHCAGQRKRGNSIVRHDIELTSALPRSNRGTDGGVLPAANRVDSAWTADHLAVTLTGCVHDQKIDAHTI